MLRLSLLTLALISGLGLSLGSIGCSRTNPSGGLTEYDKKHQEEMSGMQQAMQQENTGPKNKKPGKRQLTDVEKAMMQQKNAGRSGPGK